MNYGHPELRDRLAAEYALGSLDGEELAAAEALARREPAFALLVVDWQQRLAPLVEALPAVTPPPQVLDRIERVLPAAEPDPVGRFAASLLRRVNAWRWVAAGFAVALARFFVRMSPAASMRLTLDGFWLTNHIAPSLPAVMSYWKWLGGTGA